MIQAAYYNEIDQFAAQWLRNLIAGGHIAPGEVDERSIEDVTPDDLRGFTQCHFFAGIGVWSHSLRLAGWPDDKTVWTGSCRASLSARQAKEMGLLTSGTFGHTSSTSSASADLSMSLANRLQQVTQTHGSTLYKQTWKEWDTPSGLCRSRQRASVRRTSESELTGWPTPVANTNPQPETKRGLQHRLRSSSTDGLADTSGERLNRIDSLLQREESGRVTEGVLEVAGYSASGGMGNADNSRLEGHVRDDSAEGRQRQAGPATTGRRSWRVGQLLK
ncbi:DNA-cytosine methyl transferase [Salmonella enterica subsp. enterica]|uniref:DNA-cytosine methyl transferase n=1 Tax=Salmonella enterica I TaxID=59201 RepID=A0A379W4J6_SALET|nr:DNA-cytosine methyl transferase [Salmonella enterica subsp. enterica]